MFQMLLMTQDWQDNMIRKRVVKQKDDNKISEESDKKPPKFNNIETKTYKDEVIEVLNILESQGIDIYDSENYPGMYLKNNSKVPQKLKTVFTRASSSNEASVEEKQNLDNLFKFFKNNSNGKKE